MVSVCDLLLQHISSHCREIGEDADEFDEMFKLWCRGKSANGLHYYDAAGVVDGYQSHVLQILQVSQNHRARDCSHFLFFLLLQLMCMCSLVSERGTVKGKQPFSMSAAQPI